MKSLLLILCVVSLPITAWAEDPTSGPMSAAPETVASTAAPPIAGSEVPARTHRRSVALVVAGAVMIPAGALMLAVSMPFWADGLDLLPNSTPGTSASDVRDIGIASAFTVASVAFVVGGSVLIAIGNRRVPATATARTTRWLEWTPTLSYAHGTTTLGLGGRF